MAFSSASPPTFLCKVLSTVLCALLQELEGANEGESENVHYTKGRQREAEKSLKKAIVHFSFGDKKAIKSLFN